MRFEIKNTQFVERCELQEQWTLLVVEFASFLAQLQLSLDDLSRLHLWALRGSFIGHDLAPINEREGVADALDPFLPDHSLHLLDLRCFVIGYLAFLEVVGEHFRFILMRPG